MTPLPSIGDVIPGRDAAGRELRISGHPESDRVVLSIWQDGRCQATLRLARADVPDVIRALVAGLVPVPESDGFARPGPDGFARPAESPSFASPSFASPPAGARPAGTVHQIRPNELDLDQPGHHDQLRAEPEPIPFTGVVTSLREVTDRFATTVIAQVRRFTGR